MESLIVSALSIVLGGFFVLARFRFFYDPSKPKGQRLLNRERHASLFHKMEHCGMRVHPKQWGWFAAVVEVVAGLMLVFGVLRAVGAALLLGILVVATMCTAKAKVCEQKPVDGLDVCCAYMWRVEGLYIVMAVLILIAEGSKALSAVMAWAGM